MKQFFFLFVYRFPEFLIFCRIFIKRKSFNSSSFHRFPVHTNRLIIYFPDNISLKLFPRLSPAFIIALFKIIIHFFPFNSIRTVISLLWSSIKFFPKSLFPLPGKSFFLFPSGNFFINSRNKGINPLSLGIIRILFNKSCVI